MSEDNTSVTDWDGEIQYSISGHFDDLEQALKYHILCCKDLGCAQKLKARRHLPGQKFGSKTQSYHYINMAKCRVVLINRKGGKQSEGLGCDEVIVGGGGEPMEG